MMRQDRGMAEPADRTTWTVTTHQWAWDVDVAHLEEVRAGTPQLTAGDVVHMILEVLAYADEEAAARGRRGNAVVTLAPDEISIADDGRGTDTRVDADGSIIRKPIMATKDVRFYDSPAPPDLPDGRPRRSMSSVSALCELVIHENRRTQGAWSQTYRYGVPALQLRPLKTWSGTGTTVRFRCTRCEEVSAAWLQPLASEFKYLKVTVLEPSTTTGT